MDRLREIDRVLYKLKREYGNSVTFKQPTSTSVDYETGDITREYDEWTVRKAIVLNTKSHNRLIEKLSKFNQGDSVIPQADLKIVINSSDLQDHDLTKDTKIVVSSKTYDVLSWEATYSNKGIVIYIKETE